MPQPLALRGRLFLSRGCSASVCDRSSRAFQRLRSVDSYPQSPPRASPPALGAEYRRPRGGHRRRCQISTTKPGSVRQPPIPERLSPLQQQQLNGLFKEFSDVFSQGEDDLGCTPLLEHTIETPGPPLRQPYRRQNPAVRQEEMAQVQQMLASDVIRPSNSPWASPVVMV